MSPKKISVLCLFNLILAISFCSASCSSQPKEAPKEAPKTVAVEQPVQPPTPTATAILPLAQSSIEVIPAKEIPKPAPPKPEEVTGVLDRTYQKAVVNDKRQENSFVVGDFNGDGSEDIAIAVKPAILGDINSEFANWTLEDPTKVRVTAELTVKKPVQPAPVKAEKGDTLLAIVHGVGSEGWRNPEAKQTYLLKNGAGTNMVHESMANLRKQKIPRVRGDAIREQIGGKSGVIFWTGTKYAWYPTGSE